MIAANLEQLIKIVHGDRVQVTELVRITWTIAVDGDWVCTAAVLVGKQTAGAHLRRVGDLTCEQYDPRTAADMPRWLPGLIEHLAPAFLDEVFVTESGPAYRRAW